MTLRYDGHKVYLEVLRRVPCPSPMFEAKRHAILAVFTYDVVQLKNGRTVWAKPVELSACVCYCPVCRAKFRWRQPESSPYMTDVDVPVAVAAKLRGKLL